MKARVRALGDASLSQAHASPLSGECPSATHSLWGLGSESHGRGRWGPRAAGRRVEHLFTPATLEGPSPPQGLHGLGSKKPVGTPNMAGNFSCSFALTGSSPLSLVPEAESRVHPWCHHLLPLPLPMGRCCGQPGYRQRPSAHQNSARKGPLPPSSMRSQPASAPGPGCPLVCSRCHCVQTAPHIQNLMENPGLPAGGGGQPAPPPSDPHIPCISRKLCVLSWVSPQPCQTRSLREHDLVRFDFTFRP